MTTIITRLYANKTAAAKVVKALQDEGFMQRDIDMIESPGSKPTAAQMRKVNAALADAQVFPTAAKAYSEKIKDGNSLVVVRPPFGGTVAAQRIVDSFDTVDSGLKNEDTFVYPRSNASIIRNWPLPTLLPGDARFMSGGIFPALTNGGRIFGGLPQVIEKNPNRRPLFDGQIMGFLPQLVRYRQS